jgi:transaldolase
MQILLDSAIIKEAREAASWGWVNSATTNPTLLAQSELAPAAALKELGKIFKGHIFYQLTGEDLDSIQKEAALAFDILGAQLVLKIPATSLGFQATTVLSRQYPCAVTSIFSPAQAMVAHAAGARYALYYHNRAKRLLPEGQGERLPSELVAVLSGTDTQVVAASLKTPQEMVEARLAGVTILSTKFDVLALMPLHEFSEQALKEFKATGTGLLA